MAGWSLKYYTIYQTRNFWVWRGVDLYYSTLGKNTRLIGAIVGGRG